MAATLNAAPSMGKNFSTIQSVVKNCESLTLKQMFDVIAQLVTKRKSMVWTKFIGKRILGNVCHWLVMKQLSISSTKVYVFSDSVLCLGRVLQHQDSNEAWKNRIARIQSVRNYGDYDCINGESTEFQWNIFLGFTTLQLCDKINDLLSDLGETPETFTRRILFMSMFNDILCQERQQRWIFGKCRRRQSTCEKIWWWTMVIKVLKRSGILQRSPQGIWDHIVDEMLLEFAESWHPIFRATTPLSRGILTSKGQGKLSIHFAAPKGWIQGNTRIGPVLEVMTCNLWGKYGVGIGIWSPRWDNSQSCVRLSHGSNEFVIDSNWNHTHVLADPLEEQTSQSSVKVFAARSKTKEKPQRREPSLSAYEISKKLINLLRLSDDTTRI